MGIKIEPGGSYKDGKFILKELSFVHDGFKRYEPKLYAFYPQGHGPYSFFVMADCKKDAIKAIEKYIRVKKVDRYSYEGFPDEYEQWVFGYDEVAINDNQ